MRYNIMAAYVVAAFAAALMLSSVLVAIPQADGAPQRAHICNSHSPNGGTSPPPCGPLRAR